MFSTLNNVPRDVAVFPAPEVPYDPPSAGRRLDGHAASFATAHFGRGEVVGSPDGGDVVVQSPSAHSSFPSAELRASARLRHSYRPTVFERHISSNWSTFMRGHNVEVVHLPAVSANVQ